jgi:NTP pyrophosphatase (non-canonical NTP hydrolase)
VTFDEYQQKALKTAYTDPQHAGTLMEKTIWAMGIAGEAGEVVEKWKKIVAYKGGQISTEDTEELKKELGDVVWYVALLADSLGLSFDEVMELNIRKLASRQKRSKIKGAGDNR